MVFNESFVNVKSTLEENKIEDENRNKANRLSAFYRYYADQQLTRIITSFIKDDDSFENPMDRIEDD